MVYDDSLSLSSSLPFFPSLNQLKKDLFSLTRICINTNIILEIDGFFMFKVLKLKSFMSGAIFPLFAYLLSDLLCSSSDSSALLSKS